MTSHPGQVPITKLIERLEVVKEIGLGKYIARCPAHDDHSPSLSINEKDDCILLHCFAGCEAEDILSSIGLEFRDMYPDKLNKHFYKPRRHFDARQALACLDHESMVIAIIGADFLRHEVLDKTTWNRLALAVNRIGDGRILAAPLRHKPGAVK